MSRKREREAPRIRELFVEELAEVRGGDPGPGPVVTTQACCEEIVDSCCGIVAPA